MRTSTCRTAVLLGTSFVLGMLLFSGATAQDISSEKALSSAAESYWNFRMEGKFEETYKMEDREGLPPLEKYRADAARIKRLDIASHKLKNVRIKDSKGTVIVEFLLRIKEVAALLPSPLEDHWVNKDGRWLHKFE